LSAEHSRRVRLATVIAVCAALCASAPAAIAGDTAAAGSAQDRAAAPKKKKRKKKCNSREQSPLFNALSCTRLFRAIPNEPPTPAGSERWDFCRNHTYRYRKFNWDFDGRSYATTYRGRWKVISSTSGSAGVSGAIQYSVTRFRSLYNDGTPAEAQPPSVVSDTIAFGPFGVDFAGGTFLRGKARC
jgi:hypothetical protein